MKNNLNDLNSYLFESLDRLGNEDLKGDQLQEEIQRAKTITGVASQIIANGQLLLKAVTVKNEYMGKNDHLPALLEGDDK